MSIPRRGFVTTTARAALAATLPMPRAWWDWSQAEKPTILAGAPGATTLHDPQIKALALTAVEAARHAGAGYADVRLTYTRNRGFTDTEMTEDVTLGLSVRALVDGYWGWAATPYVATSEAPRVGAVAVALAKLNAASRQVRRVEWGTIPVVSDGSWSTPLRLDPLEVAIPQGINWVGGLKTYITDFATQRGFEAGFEPGEHNIWFSCQQQERVLASTEGSYLTQTVTVSDAHVGFVYRDQGVLLPFRPAQQGYEIVTDTPWLELIRQAMEKIDANWGALRLPRKPLEIGRYDVVFGARAMATLVAQTLGTAAQVDRALGYEANAGGTSYLGPDPLTLLGTPVASPLVTVTADRTAPKALATIQWDDDGVVPEAFPLVKEGVLVDYQTTREQAAWLAPWYGKAGRPVRSHGCAGSTDALTLPIQHTPNLTLAPGPKEQGLEELIASLDHGLVVEEFAGGEYSRVDMDFQVLNGVGEPGRVTVVRQGKRVAYLVGRCGFMFRSPELWKHVKAIGGPQSVEQLHDFTSRKGEPEQESRYSVNAVPALITDVALIDITRKA